MKELERIQQERNAALPSFARAGEVGFPANPFRQPGTGAEGTEEGAGETEGGGAGGGGR